MRRAPSRAAYVAAAVGLLGAAVFTLYDLVVLHVGWVFVLVGFPPTVLSIGLITWAIAHGRFR